MNVSGLGDDASLSVTLGTGTHHVVISSWPELVDGSYQISTSTTLCGQPLAMSVYNTCKPFVDSGGCDRNPCTDYGTSPDFCCITANCRSGYGTGSDITIQQSSPICNP